MSNRFLKSALAVAALFAILASVSTAPAASPPAAAAPIAREIYVPFEELNVLLEGPVRRVLMSREEYDALLLKAKKNPAEKLPHQASLSAADYDVRLEDLRAQITAKLTCDVLADGLQALSFDLGGVGIQEALLDGKPASLRRTSGDGLILVVEGRGRHELTLKMVALLETNANEQTLKIRLPRLPASRLRVSAEGNVEVRGGADLISRSVDEASGRTQLELLPTDGPMALALSLNNRTRRQQKVVVARSVVIDEVTSAYERLHATVSFSILHQAVDKFRFAIPEGFEISEVQSPLLARWSTMSEQGRRVLEVVLRQETTEGVVLNIAAIRSPAKLEAWTFPKLEPLDTVGRMSVVGLLLEDRLKAEDIQAGGMLPIDNGVLAQALPASIFAAEPGAPRVRPVVAYYAPDGAIDMQAKFTRPATRLSATTNLLLSLADDGLDVRGGFALAPEAEALHEFDFTVPAGWTVTEVTADGDVALAFERYGNADAANRIHVRLANKIAAGATGSVYFHATSIPGTWLDAWTSTNIEFPVFAVVGAAIDTGALAIRAKDDLTVRPDVLTSLTPLDDAEQPKYGLVGVAGQLAYRYDAPGYQATLVVERTKPRLIARTYSFLRVDSDVLTAHYELVYDISRARSRRLEFTLPASTPASITLRGLDGLVLKEYTSKDVEAGRVWSALLSDAAQGRVRLAVDFQQPLPKENTDKIPLPIIRAAGVAYQSGVVAVEGNAELDVQVVSHPRKVDVGELAEAEYQTGRRLLGAFGFVGDESATVISVARHPAYGLQPALVQSAKYVTVLGAGGRAQTSAEFQLRTKAGYLEAKLPAGSTLWSVILDGQTTQPQREGDRVLLGFPSAESEKLRTLKIAYETETARLLVFGRIEIPALGLYLRSTSGAAPQEVPTADARWELRLPSHYRVLRSEGTMTSEVAAQPGTLAAANVAGLLFALGGSDFFSMSQIKSARETGRLAQEPPSSNISGSLSTTTPTDGVARKPGELPSPIWASDEDADIAKLRSRLAAPAAPKADMPAAAKKFDRITIAQPTSESAPGLAAQQPNTPTVNSPTTAPAKPAPKSGPSGFGIGSGSGSGKGSGYFDLAGVRSLKIELQSTSDVAVFQSLGIDPRLDVTLVDERRVHGIAIVTALAVFLYGVVLTRAPRSRKLRYVLIVGALTTFVPMFVMRQELAPLLNPSFYTACLLLVYYVAAGIVRRTYGMLMTRLPKHVFGSAMALVALAGAGTAVGAEPMAQAPTVGPGTAPFVVQITPPTPPVRVPDDAVILLYQDVKPSGLPSAEQLLVPYDRYQELWNRANPQKRTAHRPPTNYSVAGAAYRSKLEGDAFLLVEGWIDYELFTDEFVQIPLPLAGGVLASAALDGKPARLNFAAPAANNPAPQQGMSQQAAMPPAPVSSALQLVASGRGKHRLELAVRLSLEKAGGWRIAEATLPVAPATSLTLTVPQADTDVRLGGIPDRRSYTTTKADETIATALGSDGALRVEWRAKVNVAQVDDSLKARSDVVFAVQDDGLRLAWHTTLEFGSVRRERFTVVVPPDYLVERVTGRNVRGWEPREVGNQRKLDIDLLRPASNQEEFAIFLSRRTHFDAMPTTLDVPVVGIEGAAVHNGNVSIRRSSILDLRTVETTGLSRIDAVAGIEEQPATADRNDVSPLGMRNYESYRFVAVPFGLKLSIVPLTSKALAETNAILKIAERERRFEAQVKLRITGAPIHRLRAYLPEGLRLDQVSAPGTFEWSVTTVEGRSLLTIYFAAGHTGNIEVLVTGLLGAPGPTLSVPLPRLEILDVERQEGHLVVQIDPAFDVQTADLRGCEQELLDRTFGWLREAQRPLARIALRTTSGDYGGTIKLTARQPSVRCQTVTNVRVTDRAIEETILLDFTIRDAGVREVAFLIPAALADAKIEVPQLREKKIEPVGTDGKLVRVRLQLQDETMGQLRVLVENDRLRTTAAQAAPIPIPETGGIGGRFVTLEGFGRDELVVDKTVGLEQLGRQQQQWQVIAGLLRGGATEAYRVEPAAVDPQLTYVTRTRATVETVGARIGLAETVLTVDAFGAYRGVQTYRLDNKTEQFLTVELPDGATLWTAWVAGEPVKPIPELPPAAARRVRIPLVKTAEGDLDYELKLVYGGKLAAPQSFQTITFPLILTVNVKVELSQVRLYLPESFDWIEFDGTMRLVQDESALQAGSISYFNKSTEKLALTLERGDEFAKARAANSLRELKSDVGSYVGMVKSGAGTLVIGNADTSVLNQELDRNDRLWKEAEKQQSTHSAQQMPQAAAATITMNSSALNSVYQGQANARSKNVVTGIGGNFDPSAPQTETISAPTTRFDSQWLNSNGLVGLNGTNDAGGRVNISSGGTLNFEGNTRTGSLSLGNSNVVLNGAPMAPQVAQGKAKESLAKDLAAKGEMSQLEAGRGMAGGKQQAAQAYERRLGEQSRQNFAQRGLPIDGIPEQRAGAGVRQIFGKPAGDAKPAGSVFHDADLNPEYAGLAGLDIEIPQRGKLYRFTTPLGDAKITGRPVSAAAIGDFQRLAIVVGVLVALLLVRRFVGRFRFAWFHETRLGAFLLIGLGLVCMLTIVPLLGALMLFVGLMLLLCRFTQAFDT